MADLSDGSMAAWVQAGGVVAFAGAVLLELRALRPTMDKIREVLSALLERERIRTERRRDPSRPPERTPEWVEPETTDLHELIAKERRRTGKAQTPPAGIRSPRPGTHHDE